MKLFTLLVCAFFVLTTDGLKRIPKEEQAWGVLMAEMVMQTGHDMLRGCHIVLGTVGKPTAFVEDLLR